MTVGWIRCTRRGVALIGAIVGLLAASASPAAAEYSVRVDRDYFGVNYPLMPFDPPAVRDAQLASIHASGIGTVRGALSWATLEPAAPSGGTHSYDWTNSDKQVSELARYQLRLSPAFMYTPGWAAPGNPLGCGNGQSVTTATTRYADYAAAAAAAAARYGPSGSFWAQHPELPAMPITTWQIWNEPNLRSYWCPAPNPAAYAQLFSEAATAIHAVDPNARVVTSGLVLADRPGQYMGIGEFYAGMTNAQPDIWAKANGVGIHVFPAGELEQQFSLVAHFREQMTAAGVPKTLPMYATEVGWGLQSFGLTEAARAQRYDFVTERAPSSNCNLAVMYAHAWTTSPPGGIVWDYDSGIADRSSGALFPSAVAFRDAIAVLQGRGQREALHPRLDHCKAMPKLDRDADGRADRRDYYPHDPKRWKGPPGWYTGVALRGKAKQTLGKAVVVKAGCEEACKLSVQGTVRLSGEAAKFELKRVRAKLKAGKAKRVVLKLSRRAASQLKRADASRGKAKLKATSIVEGERFRDRFTVRLR